MKYGKNDKFKGIDKMKERETLFVEYITELKKREKAGVKVKQEKVCLCFEFREQERAWFVYR